MKLTRFHVIVFLVLSVMCAACPSSKVPPFSRTTSIVSRRGIQSVVVNGPACVIEVKDGKWVEKKVVSFTKKGDLLKASPPPLAFDDDSSVQITVLPAEPSPENACGAYDHLKDAPYICMKCKDLSASERARYEEDPVIPCCP